MILINARSECDLKWEAVDYLMLPVLFRTTSWKWETERNMIDR